MQTQKEFANELKETVNKLMGERYRVEMHRTEKVNVETVCALVISNGRSNISPSFYIEKLYSDYQQGKATIQKMAESIVHTYFHNTNLFVKEKEFKTHFNDMKWIKKRLFLQLINSSKNRKLLKNYIYMDFSGLSLVLYVMISNDEDGIGKVRITKAMLDNFGWKEKKILSYALKNTIRLFPYEEFPFT